MYRSTAQIPSSNIATTALPASRSEKDRTSISPEVSRLLAEKRQQIDDEIVLFKTLKEKEFREFEKDLLKRKNRRRKEKESSKPKDGTLGSQKHKAEIPTPLSLLGALNPSNLTDDAVSVKRGVETDHAFSKPSPATSKPTLSIEKLNITSETTPPSTIAGSPPSPTNVLRRHYSRSPTNQQLFGTPPRIREAKLEQPLLTPPIPNNDRDPDNFAGIFSPAYLPLLENGDSHKSGRSNSFSTSHSRSASDPISPIGRKDRSFTAPTLPSGSLPSALRTASGTPLRKRKHVTFRLADSAIVEPSSSYEEGPSPAMEGDLDFDEKIDTVMVNGNGEDDTDDETKSSFSKKGIRSPKMIPREQETSDQDEKLSPRSPLEVDVQGDTGIGFFELDEELASPGHPSHDAKFIDDDMEDVEKSEEIRKQDEQDLKHEMRQTYEYSGSLPIAIARPSSSWVGSFGH